MKKIIPLRNHIIVLLLAFNFGSMKNLSLIYTLLFAIVVMAACDPKKPGNEELIVGKWEVETYYHWSHDFTAETYEEVTYLPSDTDYIGYDSVEFNADGTSRWHMSDLYVCSGMFTDPYKHFSWIIDDDTLIISSQEKYAIKELNNENLVIEEYVNNGHEEYSHHHWEQIHRYTLKRVQ